MDALVGKRILVVEDDYFLADDLATSLQRAGATVLGPVPNVDQALAIVRANAAVDAAILDINLGGDTNAYPVAEALRERGVPFALATGYDLSDVRGDFAEAPHVTKPMVLRDVVRALFGE